MKPVGHGMPADAPRGRVPHATCQQALGTGLLYIRPPMGGWKSALTRDYDFVHGYGASKHPDSCHLTSSRSSASKQRASSAIDAPETWHYRGRTSPYGAGFPLAVRPIVLGHVRGGY